MKLKPSDLGCQIPSLRLLADGTGEVPPQSLMRRLKLAIRRRLSPAQERAFKAWSNELMNRLCKLTGRQLKPVARCSGSSDRRIQAGDWVRVRSLEEIEATLNHWRQLRGCTFMPEMAAYCGTIQRVLKRMERFVDERDLCVKTSKGIVLLAGVICEGTADFGSCDRSCFYFWREEWLEKISEPEAATPERRAKGKTGGDRGAGEVLTAMLSTPSLDCG